MYDEDRHSSHTLSLCVESNKRRIRLRIHLVRYWYVGPAEKTVTRHESCCKCQTKDWKIGILETSIMLQKQKKHYFF